MSRVFLSLATAALLFANDQFFEAARKGDVAALKTFLDQGMQVDAKWRYDQTALFMAARNGHLEAVKLLLERGANADAKDSFYKMTALGGAVDKANPALIRLLLDKGATGADQAMTMAISQKKPAPVVKALADSGKVSAEAMSNGLTTASATGLTEIAEILKAAGAKPIDEPKLDPELLARYSGSYRDAGNNEMKLAVAGGRLQVTAMGQVIPLRAIDATTFAPLPYPTVRLTLKLDGDKVTGLEFKQGQIVQQYTRVEAK